MATSLTRRGFLECAAATAGQSAAAAKTKQRPNILLILADDMGFSDIGCFGSEIPTPNLDRLAKSGIRLTQFNNTARCCPSRAALLTGLYNHQTGVGHMVDNRGTPEYQGFLNNKCVTIAEALGAAGYRTAMSGKWHVGEDRPHWPKDRGFERYFGLISGASSYFRLDSGRKMAIDNEPYVPEPGKFYMTDAITDHALGFLDGFPKSDPFFLYCAYTAPHWPLHAWPEDIAKHRGKYRKGWDALRKERHERQIAMGIVDRKWGITGRDARVPAWEDAPDKDLEDLRMAVYAAQIDRLDQNIGRILKRLEETRQIDNTLIVFLADNGGCAEENIGGEKPGPPGGPESFTSYHTGWANASNTPFRLYKHWVHEGGIATPFIAHCPALIRSKGTVTHQHAHLIDVMATCLDVAGAASYPKTFHGNYILPLEGKSLLPVFQGRKREGHDHVGWEHEGNRALRQGDWKLVSRYPGTGYPERWELYNLAEDRTEMHDRAGSDPERVKKMSALYNNWARRCGVMDWNVLRRRGPGSA